MTVFRRSMPFHYLPHIQYNYLKFNVFSLWWVHVVSGYPVSVGGEKWWVTSYIWGVTHYEVPHVP